MSPTALHELLAEARRLPEGPARVALCEAAVREADASGDLDAGYNARLELISAAEYSGADERALVAFSWCLAQFDRHPDRFHPHGLLWRYKWILDNASDFPQLSLAQIERMEDDMEARVTRLGWSPRPVHYLRWANRMRIGNPDGRLMEFFEKWEAAPRDALADCPACERNKHIELLVRLGENERSLEVAAPILAGFLSCAEVPDGTYARLLTALVRLGQTERARELQRRGHRAVSRKPALLYEAASHVIFLVETGDLARAARLLEKNLPWAVATANVNDRFSLYLAATRLTQALADRPRKTRKLDLPRELPCYQADGTYRPAELANWFRGESVAMARQFDERNGTAYNALKLDHGGLFPVLPAAHA
ncbi:MAG TPA: hypothetical protein VML55_23795 [Planctomycetaceae bacterium]|nr:hypothetical protein [Planctomycetaceae bacterium]